MSLSFIRSLLTRCLHAHVITMAKPTSHTLENVEVMTETEGHHGHTLGTHRLRDANSPKTIILIPTPSSDPNDPLNWYGSVSKGPIKGQC